MKSFRIIIMLVLASLVSCQGDQNKADNESNGQSVENALPIIGEQPGQLEAGSLTGDTLNISGKLMLFFGPVESATGEQAVPAEELAAYKSVATRLIDSLSTKSDIKAMYSTAGYFRIYTSNGSAMIITKSALKTETGVLMTDGSQPPSIRKGTFSENEYQKHIKSYFIGQ